MKVLIFVLFFNLFFCLSNLPHQTNPTNEKYFIIDSTKNVLSGRFLTPNGFSRVEIDTGSFAFFLQQQQLYPIKHEVLYYNGAKKSNKVYDGVLTIDVGKRDLQQCADAVMRLRAEYLFQKKDYAKIGFIFLGDGKMHNYLDYAKQDRTYATFRKYMDYVFAYANTASLKKQLNPINKADVGIGDVLIQKGNPYGHAVIVMDMCQDSLGRKNVLLAQSYLPAQEIHVLKNYKDLENSPWYNTNSETISTPEWTFTEEDWARF